MPDNIVSVRMPDSLLNEMKKTASEQHYMDVSEAVRAVVKQKIGEYSEKLEPAAKEELIASLQNLITKLQDEAKQEH